jgi:hypothetical protein
VPADVPPVPPLPVVAPADVPPDAELALLDAPPEPVVRTTESPHPVANDVTARTATQRMSRA